MAPKLGQVDKVDSMISIFKIQRAEIYIYSP